MAGRTGGDVMVAVRMRCGKCHQRFTRPQGSRRIYCETCSPSRVKPLDPEVRSSPDIPGPIEASVRAQLEAAERAGTVQGLVALSVAADLDAGRVAPAQKPGVGQKLAALVASAVEGTAPPTCDRLDELAEARTRRASA
jgi:DNA-directed RNA polymerase subunit RPC12/RpoP